jgi:uncharacterized protein
MTKHLTTTTTKANQATRYLRVLMLAIALALPMLSLAVFGSIWLWQNGYVLHWAVAALLTTTTAFAVERWLLRDAFQDVRNDEELTADTDLRFASETEAAAWRAVLKLAEDIEPDTINSRDSLIDLGKRTVETVARQMHPGHKNPTLKFTLPELLALIENVSAKLGPFVRETIPLGDKLTVGQFLAIYRWRGILDVADKAYDIWRIIRLMNPATAVAQELREKFTRQLYDWGRRELARRLTHAYIREVGRSAIDLYSGRLRERTSSSPAPPQTIEERVSPPDHTEIASQPAAEIERPRASRFGAVKRVFRQTGNAARLIFSRKDRNDKECPSQHKVR